MGEQGLSCCQGQWGVLGLCALWGWKPPGNSRLARSGAWGSLGCVVACSWHCVASWVYLLGSKVSRLESSGVHQAVEALWSTCIGAWTSRSLGSCCRHRRTKPAGSGSFGAWFPTEASRSAALWHCCLLRRAKPAGGGSFRIQFPAWASGSAVLWCFCWLRRAKPVGLGEESL
jgi:hypothetical protein